ncbi:Na/Pi cotransporter family protein [Granulicatella seriolae]|uniref:Na/Pi cotransporter family protein n=1 Tax=Granulicatella seriolae TaxID=2967226 RepID=A0ABT1WPB5_9LACT|nr:Na/Pi cotransporter family protein [Granulicatella seriolae]
MYLEMVLGSIAGLGLFLYGMKLMADGLQKVAGNRLKGFIKTLTKNRFMSVLVGMFVTMIIQSSSATSVMVVGFVNAGIMTLQQAIGVIFGANIGTTITGQMVSLNLTQWAPIAIASGILMRSLVKNNQLKDTAEILIGFGILFIGMNYLKEALAPLKDMPQFAQWIVDYGHNPLFGIAIGFLMTLALQSSSATIGVLIALASQGILPFTTALYIIYGDNMGTCTTALISSLGTSRKGKQVATLHLMINVIGTFYFMLFLNGILTNIVQTIDPTDVARQIANAHTIFNVVNVIFLFPFANYLIKLVTILIPDTKVETIPDEFTTYLDERILISPAIALKNTVYEFVSMANETHKTIDNSIKAIQERDKDYILKAYENEDRVNTYEKAIIEYLIQLSQQNVSNEDLIVIDELFNTANDIERISDHAENIADSANILIDKNIQLDDQVVKELNYVFDLVKQGFNLSIDAFSTGDLLKVGDAIEIEREIDRLKLEIRDKHIKRMNKGIASPESGIFVMDLLSNLERMSDHFRNICETIKKLGNQLTA